MQPTRTNDFMPTGDVLAVSLELSKGSWKIALHDGKRNNPAVHTVRAEAALARFAEAVQVIETIRAKWHLPADCRVVVSYEAGQDGFWIAREGGKHGYEMLVVDPASIPVPRQARRAKTDRLDALLLVEELLNWLHGQRQRMRVVHAPDEDAEEQRQGPRQRGDLQKEVQQHQDRIRKLLRLEGCWEALDDGFPERLRQGAVRRYDGRPLPRSVQARLLDECERLALAAQQFQALEARMVTDLPAPVQADIAALMRLKAVGVVGAMRLRLELYWREFANRREVGACVGLVPQPYDSGESRVDQGISKRGNRRVRALSIEMAWMWLRHQPGSALAKWFARRTQGTGKRGRRIMIVALARRLVIALWRYLTDGVVPEGAVMKRVPTWIGKTAMAGQ